MLTREEVIEITRANADKNRSDPFTEQHDEVGIFGTDEYLRICQAIYRRAVEDAIDRATELGAIERDGVFAEEIRNLLEQPCYPKHADGS